MTDEITGKSENKKNSVPSADSGRSEEEKGVALDAISDETKSVLSDKLDVPGGLEVEEMSESVELQKRREQTKKKLKELSEVDEDKSDDDALFEGGGGSFSAILKEAGLSSKHLKFCSCGLFVFIFIILVGAVLVSGFGRGDSSSKTEKTKKIEKKDKVVTTVDRTDGTFHLNGNMDDTINSGVLVGAHELNQDLTLKAGEDIGTVANEEKTEYEDLFTDFRDAYEILQVDVRELLDQSHDRKSTLDEYLDKLNFHLYRSKTNVDVLRNGIADISMQVDEVAKEQKTLEENFFKQFQDLNVYGSNAALEQYVDSGQSVVELRANLKARQNLLEFYNGVQANLELRIRDIEFNREALLLGVQVVSLNGSTLDLIVDEKQL